VSVKHFLAEDQDTHDEVIVLGPGGQQKLDELEHDLLAVRHDYHELGQRASALASERDAIAAALQAATADAQASHERLADLQAQYDRLAVTLESRLQAQQAELEQERTQRRELEQQLQQTDTSLEERLAQYQQDHRARESELAGRLASADELLSAAKANNADLATRQEQLLAELNGARQALAAAREDARGRIGELERHCHTLVSERDQALQARTRAEELARQDTGDLKQRASELQTALTAALEQGQHHQTALSDAEAQLAGAATRIGDLEQHVDSLTAELEQAHQASASAQQQARQQVADLERRASQLESDLSAVHDQAQHYQTALTSAEAQLASASDRIGDLEQHVDSLTVELEQAHQASASTQQQARQQVGELERRASQLENDLSAAHQQAQHYQAALTSAEAQLAAASTRIGDLEQHVDSLTAELEQAHQASASVQQQAREQVADLERHATQLESEHSKALEHALGLETALAATARQQHNSETRAADLERQLQSHAAELQALQKRAANAEQQAREQIEALDRKAASLDTERTDAVNRAQQLEARLSDAQAQQESSVASAADRELALQEQLDRLGGQIEAMRTTHDQADREHEQLRDERSRLVDTVSELEARLAETKRLHESDRQEAAAKLAGAEQEQRTLGEKVRQLAEQLHQQHQQQDQLEQQARDRAANEASLRDEFERSSAELQAEIERLTQELARHHAAPEQDKQPQPDSSAAPQHDLSGGPNSWKTVAGVSLLLGSVATATAYWSTPRNVQPRTVAESAAGAAPRDPVVTSFAAPHTPPSTALQTQHQEEPVGSDAETSRAPAPGAASPAHPDSELNQGGDAARAAAADSSRITAAMRVSPALKQTARESLRAMEHPLKVDASVADGDTLIRQQQQNLIALGFDLGETQADGVKGRRTRQALSEFRQYYLPLTGLEHISDERELASLVNVFADIARDDQQAFGIDNKVLTAIRLGSLRTGMDFPYLMELAYTESSFNPAKKAKRSSATGLYQFTDSTWLQSIKRYGKKYGLELYAAQIHYVTDDDGRQHPRVDNPIVQRHILALRYEPRIATLMAAEFALANKKQLSRSLGKDFGRTELYLAHFFGSERALRFLQLLEQDRDRSAADLFPTAAQSNPGVFEPWEGQQRTLQEVYDFFAAKFDTGRYEILNPGLALVRRMTR
jgi:peptidoglycan hydrolase-like protein with peptidoglycan-binding domain/predicted  nucleic acid-binding Zn-ribbon protein